MYDLSECMSLVESEVILNVILRENGTFGTAIGMRAMSEAEITGAFAEFGNLVISELDRIHTITSRNAYGGTP